MKSAFCTSRTFCSLSLVKDLKGNISRFLPHGVTRRIPRRGLPCVDGLYDKGPS
jgi:hypothetical protein